MSYLVATSIRRDKRIITRKWINIRCYLSKEEMVTLHFRIFPLCIFKITKTRRKGYLKIRDDVNRQHVPRYRKIQA